MAGAAVGTAAAVAAPRLLADLIREEPRAMTPVPRPMIPAGSNNNNNSDHGESAGSFLEQFIPAEKAPTDAEGANLATNTARLINTLWTLQ